MENNNVKKVLLNKIKIFKFKELADTKAKLFVNLEKQKSLIVIRTKKKRSARNGRAN